MMRPLLTLAVLLLIPFAWLSYALLAAYETLDRAARRAGA